MGDLQLDGRVVAAQRDESVRQAVGDRPPQILEALDYAHEQGVVHRDQQADGVGQEALAAGVEQVDREEDAGAKAVAKLLDYDVIIVDPRTAFATSSTSPGRKLSLMLP